MMERVPVQIDLDQPDADDHNLLKNAKRAKTQVASDISANIRKMLNNPDYSDVNFLCKDGVLVSGCRLFLAAQSEVLHRMFQNGMAESQLSVIPLQGFASTEFRSVLEYLYTGVLQQYAPKDWKSAYEIIGAAKFFLLEGLELLVFEYLLHAVAQVGEDLGAAAKFLSISMEFIGTMGKNVEIVARDLVRILKFRSLQPAHLKALSSSAFMFLLQETETKNGKPKYLSPEEFVRFRTIVLWCACKEFAADKPVELPDALPSEMIATLELLDTPRKISCVLEMTQRQALASSVETYLPFVNLQRICPWSLVHTIEPMDIIPSSIIMSALRFHALKRIPSTDGGTIGWSATSKTHKMYKMNGDGSRIKQTAPGNAFAQYNMAMNRQDSSPYHHKWEILIEEVCAEFIEIGLYRDLGVGLTLGFHEGQSLSGQPGGWALRLNTRGIFINCRVSPTPWHGDPSFVPFGDKDYSRLVYGKDYGHENSKVIVSFDTLKGNCYFTFDGEDPVLAWSGLNYPEGSFFPAISLGSGSSGAVQIKILCNGDKEFEDEDDEDDEGDEEDDEEED